MRLEETFYFSTKGDEEIHKVYSVNTSSDRWVDNYTTGEYVSLQVQGPMSSYVLISSLFF
jgi:hypothetical protein